jgi:uncharacterized protein YjbI with pentapeptide repeats
MTRTELLENYASGERDFTYSDLSGSYLRGSDLSGSYLRGSNLSGSYLRGSNLSGSDLSGSDLSGSYLRGSNLRGSDLRGSDLRNSDLRGSNLSGSDLRNSDLSDSDLSGSNLRGSYLSGSDLSGSNGVYIFNKQGGRLCYAVVHKNKKSLMIKAGCFWGTLEEFSAEASKLYKDDTAKNYAAQIEYLRALECQL